MDSKRRLHLAAAMLLPIAFLGQGFATQSAQAGNLLTTNKVSSPPKLDGQVDTLWARAKVIQIPVFAGANFSEKRTVQRAAQQW